MEEPLQRLPPGHSARKKKGGGWGVGGMGVWEQVLEVGVCRSGACKRVIFLRHTLARISTESSAAASLTVGHIIARRGPSAAAPAENCQGFVLLTEA